MLEPLKSSVSVPACPSTVSLESPGSHWKLSLPLPSRTVSAPCWPSAKSFPAPPRMVSGPLLPSSVSLPAPPSIEMASSMRLPIVRTSSLPPPAAPEMGVKVLRST